MVKKYMHENLKHTVIKHTVIKIKRIHTFRQLLPTIANIFQISYQTILTLLCSYSQTILHTFPGIKQYWHFQRVPSKLNYSKYCFQSTCHTLMTLSESYCQIMLTYSEFMSNSIHPLTELLPNNSKHFFESLNGH